MSRASFILVIAVLVAGCVRAPMGYPGDEWPRAHTMAIASAGKIVENNDTGIASKTYDVMSADPQLHYANVSMVFDGRNVTFREGVCGAVADGPGQWSWTACGDARGLAASDLVRSGHKITLSCSGAGCLSGTLLIMDHGANSVMVALNVR